MENHDSQTVNYTPVLQRAQFQNVQLTLRKQFFSLKGSDLLRNIFPEEFKAKLESHQLMDMFAEKGREGLMELCARV